MPRPRKPAPEPAPVLSSDGIPMRLAQPLTAASPHAMVAIDSFWVGFVTHPDGNISPGRTWVTAGQLGDDRSALVRQSRKHWRRPMAADRQGGLTDAPALLDCGRPTRGSRCPFHERVAHAAYDSRAYRRRRRAVLGLPCALRLPGCTVVATTADHVVPVSRGGRDSPLRPACAQCNSARGDRDVRRHPRGRMPSRGAGPGRSSCSSTWMLYAIHRGFRGAERCPDPSPSPSSGASAGTAGNSSSCPASRSPCRHRPRASCWRRSRPGRGCGPPRWLRPSSTRTCPPWAASSSPRDERVRAFRAARKARVVPGSKEQPVLSPLLGCVASLDTEYPQPRGPLRLDAAGSPAWERDPADEGWTVPRVEVDAAIAKAMARWHILELACDPPGWGTEIEGWEREWPEVVVRFDTGTASRMAPACDRFYAAVVTGTLTARRRCPPRPPCGQCPRPRHALRQGHH